MWESLQQLELNAVIWIQGAWPFGAEIMTWITYLGYGPFYLALTALVFWGLDSRLGIRLGLMISLSGAVTEILKIAFHQPRPFWLDLAIQAHTADLSFGMPSGHALSGMAFWGLWALSLKRARFQWLLAVLIFLLGFSRFWLGVHFPSQILAGWLVGAVLLALFPVLEKPLDKYADSRGPRAGVGWALGIGAGLILGYALLRMIPDPFAVPQEWIETAASARPAAALINPLSPVSLVFDAALFSGTAMGALWSAPRPGPILQGSFFSRLGHSLLGVMGVSLIIFVFWGAARLAGDNKGVLSAVFYGCGGAAAGAAIFGLGPKVWGRLNRPVSRP